MFDDKRLFSQTVEDMQALMMDALRKLESGTAVTFHAFKESLDGLSHYEEIIFTMDKEYVDATAEAISKGTLTECSLEDIVEDYSKYDLRNKLVPEVMAALGTDLRYFKSHSNAFDWIGFGGHVAMLIFESDNWDSLREYYGKPFNRTAH